MNEFIDRNDLCVTWNHPLANTSNTYVNHNLNHESCIDHIVVSSNVFNNICSNDVTETPVNPSTQCPVTLTFSTTYSSVYTDTRSTARTPKVAWRRLNADLLKCYIDRIDLLLDSIDIPQNSVHCTDVLRENDSPRSDIDTHCKQLIYVLLRTGNETLRQCKSNATDFGTPLWNDEIDDIREVALFWHWLWIENGRPPLGHIADIMRRTRAKYHYTVHYTKRCENDRIKRKMAESVSTNNQRDLWLETKKLTSIKIPRLMLLTGRVLQKTFLKYSYLNTKLYFRVYPLMRTTYSLSIET